jgi:hypothetical protein
MDDRIRHLIDQIKTMDADLRVLLREQEADMLNHIETNRLKTGFFDWLLTNRPQNLLTGPIIYSMIIPLLILDLSVSFYQASCFPIYKITKLRRADYIIFDRQKLDYLDFIEKFHCTYCAYGSGLIAYVSAIIGKTEQYFCPIKHAHHILGTHGRYHRFLDYGEIAAYEEKLEQFRKTLDERE